MHSVYSYEQKTEIYTELKFKSITIIIITTIMYIFYMSEYGLGYIVHSSVFAEITTKQ